MTHRESLQLIGLRTNPQHKFSDQTWTLRLMGLAYEVAHGQSNDRSNQNGAVICKPGGFLVSSGACGLLPEVRDLPERHSRPLKYCFTRHAESDACNHAARIGSRTHGNVMICPWFSCDKCAIAIVRSGIKHVVGHLDRMLLTPSRWLESVQVGYDILDDAGVTYEFIEGKLGCAQILVNEELWNP